MFAGRRRFVTTSSLETNTKTATARTVPLAESRTGMLVVTTVQLVTISAAFTFGMVLALLGSLKLALAKRLNLSEGRIGGLLSAFNVTLMPMMLLTGVLIDEFGVKWVLIGASCTTAVAIVSLSIEPTYR